MAFNSNHIRPLFFYLSRKKTSYYYKSVKISGKAQILILI